MSIKVIEKLIEPVKIQVGSVFKIKIKAIRYATYQELAQKTYEPIKSFSYSDLKGESNGK